MNKIVQSPAQNSNHWPSLYKFAKPSSKTSTPPTKNSDIQAFKVDPNFKMTEKKKSYMLGKLSERDSKRKLSLIKSISKYRHDDGKPKKIGNLLVNIRHKNQFMKRQSKFLLVKFEKAFDSLKILQIKKDELEREQEQQQQLME